jgi:hypothetical protein
MLWLEIRNFEARYAASTGWNAARKRHYFQYSPCRYTWSLSYMHSRCFGFRSTIGFSPDGAAEIEFVTIRCQLVSSLTPDINLSQVNPHFKFQLHSPFCLVPLQVSLQFQNILFCSISNYLQPWQQCWRLLSMRLEALRSWRFSSGRSQLQHLDECWLEWKHLGWIARKCILVSKFWCSQAWFSLWAFVEMGNLNLHRDISTRKYRNLPW